MRSAISCAATVPGSSVGLIIATLMVIGPQPPSPPPAVLLPVRKPQPDRPRTPAAASTDRLWIVMVLPPHRVLPPFHAIDCMSTLCESDVLCPADVEGTCTQRSGSRPRADGPSGR